MQREVQVHVGFGSKVTKRVLGSHIEVKFADTHASVLALLDGEVGSLAVLVLLGLDHGLALLLGLLQAHTLLIGLTLLLLLDLTHATLLVLLLALGHALLLLGAGDLALGLLLLQALELILLLVALLAPLGDVVLQLLIELRTLLVLALHELGIGIPKKLPRQGLIMKGAHGTEFIR